MAEQTRFKEGDAIVHPSHGAGRITGIKIWEVGGVERQYYSIELINDHGTLMIPVDQVEETGLRRATIDPSDLYDILREEPSELDSDHRKRQSELAERIRSGDAILVTEALRDLAWREQIDSLTERDQKLKAEAEQLVIGELALQPGLDLESAAEELRQQIQGAIEARLQQEDEEALKRAGPRHTE